MPIVKPQISAVADGRSETEPQSDTAKGFLPDDTATPDDLKAIRAARAEYARGETVTHDAINWN